MSQAADPIVFVVDDDPSVRTALARLLHSAGFAADSFATAEEFLAHAHRRDRPCCVVLDLRMPDQSGLDLQRALHEESAELPIIFLTAHADIHSSVQAMKAGAVDFLTKPASEEALLDAVRSAVERSRTAGAAREELAGIRHRLERLTRREWEVLSFVLAGLLNKQIAAQIGTTEQTVKVHRRRVMQKMEVASLAELIHLTGRAGVPPASPHAPYVPHRASQP